MTKPQPSRRILLADDDANIRKSLRWLLKGAIDGLEFGEAPTVEEALAQVAGAPWDLVVLDIRFRGRRTGLDVLPLLRGLRPGLTVVVLSGLPEDPYAAAAVRAGAAAFISKDHAADELLAYAGRLFDTPLSACGAP